MRIYFIAPAYPLRGGIAQYTALLYKKMQERGHEVKIISFKRQYPEFLFPGKTQKESGKQIIRTDSEAIIDTLNPLTWLKAFAKIKAERPDLLIFKYWLPLFAPCYITISLLVRLFTEYKVLYICDNIIPHEKRLGDTVLTKIALRYSDYFIVLSDAVQGDLLRFRPDAVYRKVPHPVYDLFHTNYDKITARRKLKIQKERVILFFGYIRAYKGLHLILQAMPYVLKHIDITLVVAGEFYDSKEKYTDLIEELNLNYHVEIFDSFIPDEEVGTYFAAADAVVLPYISATQSGIAQIAYNFDKPVIATDVGGLSEVVVNEKTGYIVRPEDPEAFADAIVKFYSQNKNREFVSNVKVEKGKYSWDRMAEAVENLLATGSSRSSKRGESR